MYEYTDDAGDLPLPADTKTRPTKPPFVDADDDDDAESDWQADHPDYDGDGNREPWAADD